MQQIDNLSDEANQTSKIALPDGSTLVLDFRYNPAIQRWQFNATRDAFVVNGLNLCVHPNILRPWRNVVNFGLACVAEDGVDPVYIEDFASGRVSLFVLDETEVEEVEDEVFMVEL